MQVPCGQKGFRFRLDRGKGNKKDAERTNLWSMKRKCGGPCDVVDWCFPSILSSASYDSRIKMAEKLKLYFEDFS